ncbi:cytochrome P450 79B1 [Artemisia annua]|uniref:Cytochrome P450 79B1 n=1 Tax=Artemisia annua TaxID=35608 RepID=A0A2U1NF89_ARTAN|nr:cytochrome P450 79B1 [Artemisia annua]
MISSIIIVLVIVLVFAAICPSKKPSNPHPLPPGPTPLPYVGCIIQMLLNQLLLKQPIIKWIEKLMEKFKTQILCIRLGPSTHVIIVTSPELACEFLHKQDDIFISRPEILSAELVSNGYRSAILAPFGDQWRKMRKVLHQHLLSSQSHRWLEPKRNEEADHLLSYICNQIAKQENVVDGGLINIRIVSRHFCANLMTKIVFGTRVFGDGMEAGGSGEEECAHLTALFTILKYLYAFCITDYFPWLRGKIDIDGHEKKTRKALEIIRKYQDPLVDERIRMWERGARRETSDLLDALITHENPKLTPNEIKAQIIELMIATIDNPSNAVEWAMAEMINEPVLLERAVKELDKVVGRNRLVEERDLPQLNYLKACIKECFRLHPFAPLNPPHVPIMNTTVAGYFIPRGSHVMLSRRGLGRNPDVWEDPLRFEPERHLTWEENQVVLSDDDLTMISFSTGKRGCPGVVLGSTITTMLLARMVQGFSWGLPCNLSSVDLAESNGESCLAKPLVAVAKPRLPHHLYPKE